MPVVLKANVNVPDVGAVIVTAPQVALVPMVTVGDAPEEESKKTSSAEVGADAPPLPPEDVDQLVVLDEFHVPEPPTQYLFAMFMSLQLEDLRLLLLGHL